MKAIMLMFDSLNRQMLEPYGCDWTKTPNFKRLAEKTVRFTNSYAGSLPCIPARRELHTGRYNFLHRSWGPLEPFDDSMPELLKNNGVLSHLVSDHTHYWEDGGATYHTRYSSWEFIRGQEGDPWKVLPELFTKTGRPQNDDGKYFQITDQMHRQDMVNRTYCNTEEKTPIAQTFDAGLEFLEANYTQDHWFLQIECFDPHEPFVSPEKYKELYPHEYHGKLYDWPPYHHVTEDVPTANHLKMEYAALLSMCDTYLGKLLDVMDQHNLWEDTLLIVNTDHGYLLGEHGWWSKGCMPWYDELVHTPLFIHDPRFSCADTTRSQLVQTIDISATILEFFGIERPADMQGKPIRSVIEKNQSIHDYILFGVHGGHVNLFDGRYVYMKAPLTGTTQPLFEYTLMPTHMRNRFGCEEMREATLAKPFTFTKQCPVLQIPKTGGIENDNFAEFLMGNSNSQKAKYIDNNSLTNAVNFGDKLFDMELDPKQEKEMENDEIEVRLANLMTQAMRDNEAPRELFARIGLPYDRDVTIEDIQRNRTLNSACAPDILPDYIWSPSAQNAYRALMKFIKIQDRKTTSQKIADILVQRGTEHSIEYDTVLSVIPFVIPEEYCQMIYYFVSLAGRNK